MPWVHLGACLISCVAIIGFELFLVWRHSVSHHLNKNYGPLKYSDDPIGDGLVFSDLSKALKNAKELSSVTKAVDSKTGSAACTSQTNEKERTTSKERAPNSRKTKPGE